MNAALGDTTRWYHRVPYVLLMLFVVLGPFALPFLWKSPAFNKAAKILLTALVLALTAVLAVKIFSDCQKILRAYAGGNPYAQS